MKIKLTTISASVVILASSMMMSSTASAAETLLVNKSGMTLYTFDVDTDGKSYCTDGCTTKWLPYIMAEGAKAKSGYGFILRDDGSKQWTYKDKPLYTWVGDKKKGDTTGDGMAGVWHVAKKMSYSY